MTGVAIAILALAAGIHLLIQVKQNGLGTLYKGLAWTVILVAGLFIAGGVVVGAKHMRHMHPCMAAGQCDMGKGGAACDMKGNECKMDKADCSKEKMDCCKTGEEKACCKDMKGMGMSEKSDAKPSCCMEHMGTDSTTKK